MKGRIRQQKLWLPRILSRINLYFFLMSLTVFFLYVIGNFQGFSDSTILLVFRFMDLFFYIFLAATLGNLISFSIWGISRRRSKFLFYITTSMKTVLILFLYILTKFLTSLFSGNQV